MIHKYWALPYKTVWLILCLGFVNPWQNHMVAFQNMWHTTTDRMICTALHCTKDGGFPHEFYTYYYPSDLVTNILSVPSCHTKNAIGDLLIFLNNLNHARLILSQFMQLYGTWPLNAPLRHWLHYRFCVIYIQHFVCMLFVLSLGLHIVMASKFIFCIGPRNVLNLLCCKCINSMTQWDYHGITLKTS